MKLPRKKRSGIIIFITSLVMFLFSSFSYAAINDDENKLAKDLASTRTFSVGYVGIASHISQGEKDYRELLNKDDATILFKMILNDAGSTLEGKAYAACGIKQMLPESFEVLTQEMSMSNAEISVLRADILRKEKISDIVKFIGKNGCQ